MIKRAFAIVLAACAVVMAQPGDPAVKAAPPKAITPEVHEGTEARHERFNAISKEGKAELVFLGDSITEGWETSGKEVWAERYAGRKAANFGVSGDRTEHVLWRLDHGNFDGLKPKVIVVMIGTNNTGHRMDPAADTAAGVKKIVGQLRAKCPESKVLLLGIFPRGAEHDDPMRVRNEEVNAIISELGDGERVVFKDVGAAFIDDKFAMKKELMPDLLHPNAEGYKVWAEAMEPDLARMLGEAPPDSAK